MNLTQRQKRLLQWAGYPLLALVVFLFSVQLTFPYERVKDKLIHALSEKYEVSIISVEPTFLPGGLILETVVLRTRPTQPDEEPTTLLIDELRVDMGLLALLRGRADVDVTAKMGGGSIEGNVVMGPDELALAFATEALPLETVPGLRGAVGLPMKGGLDASLDIRLPEQRWDLAEGSIALSCMGCTVGDGVAKIKPGSPSSSRSMRAAIFAGQGVTVPELKLGTMAGKIEIREGRADIQQLTASSGDGDLTINGAVRFGRTFKEARFERGCMKFRLSDELKQREPNFGNLPALTGAPLQDDGYANVMMQGNLATMRWLPAVNCEDDGSSDRLSFRRGAGAGGRPSIPARVEADEPPGPAGEPGQEREPGLEVEPGEEMERPPMARPSGITSDRPDDGSGDRSSDRSSDRPGDEGMRGEFPPAITPVPTPAGAVRGRGDFPPDDIEPGYDRDRRRRGRGDEGEGGEEERFEGDDDGEEDEAARRREEAMEEGDERFQGEEELE